LNVETELFRQWTQLFLFIVWMPPATLYKATTWNLYVSDPHKKPGNDARHDPEAFTRKNGRTSLPQGQSNLWTLNYDMNLLEHEGH